MDRKQIDERLADINNSSYRFFIYQPKSYEDGYKEFQVWQTVCGHDYLMFHGTRMAVYTYIQGLWAGVMITRKNENR